MVKYKFRKKNNLKNMRNARNRCICVFVAIASDLMILHGKGLQGVIKGNEAEMDETGLLETGGKGNGGKLALT